MALVTPMAKSWPESSDQPSCIENSLFRTSEKTYDGSLDGPGPGSSGCQDEQLKDASSWCSVTLTEHQDVVYTLVYTLLTLCWGSVFSCNWISLNKLD